MEQANIPFADLPFDRAEVCCGLEITQETDSGQFVALLDEAISEAARRCRPQYAYRLFPTERIDTDSISAGGAGGNVLFTPRKGDIRPEAGG